MQTLEETRKHTLNQTLLQMPHFVLNKANLGGLQFQNEKLHCSHFKILFIYFCSVKIYNALVAESRSIYKASCVSPLYFKRVYSI